MKTGGGRTKPQVLFLMLWVTNTPCPSIIYCLPRYTELAKEFNPAQGVVGMLHVRAHM